jgi:NADH-quinone oxidoreductase subunit M
MGVWQTKPIIAIIASISIVITASYIIRVIRNVFFGKLPQEYAGHVSDISVLDKIALFVLCAFMVALGTYPSWMARWLNRV